MASSLRFCLIHPDAFCYICGEYTFEEYRKPITEFVKKAYFAYFNLSIKHQDKPWVPHFVCKTCSEHLRQWTNCKRKCMKFGIPMIWREQQNHFDDCYFCLVKIIGINRKNRSKWTYPDIPSARRPVPHSENVPVPTCHTLTDSLEEEYNETQENSEIDSDYDDSNRTSRFFSQSELNDLVRDLDLSKERAELLASRLKEKNCLAPNTRVTFYRQRERDLLLCFSEDNNLVYCNDIGGLLIKMGLEKYNPTEWRLFIDSSKRSLKCVLLHNGNKHACVPIAHSTRLNEEYKVIALLLEKIKYEDHQWFICVDLKMVNFLLGQQGGYTKFPCFMCLWDSRDKSNHWVRKNWPVRENLAVGMQNVINTPLVPRKKIILPPLHIKLGLMKQFVKALDKSGSCFQYITRAFPALSTEKLKAGIFDGPQIRQLVKDDNLASSMNETELAAWNSFVLVIKNFLGNHKAENYEILVNQMLLSFQNLGCNMSIKVHYLHSHLDCFLHNLGDLSEEQGERFHQDIKVMEDRYQGRWDTHMMADYCWALMRDNPKEKHTKKSNKRKFLYLEQ